MTLTRRGEIVAYAGAFVAIAIALGLGVALGVILGLALGPKVAVGIPLAGALLVVLMLAWIAAVSPHGKAGPSAFDELDQPDRRAS